MKLYQDVPDLIVTARRCYTFGPRPRLTEALAIRAGRIVAVGTRRAMLALRSRRTRVLSVPDAVLTPGLVDCHTHFFYWALGAALVIDVSDLDHLDAVLARLRAGARTRHVGEWVLGRGFDYNRWGATPPTARDLDHAIPDRPALVHSRDGHSAWLNSIALRKLRITARTPDPSGGRYLRDARGQPTGIVQEAALEHLPDPLRLLAQRTDAQARGIIDRALVAAYRTAWRFGIVGVHTMDDGPSLTHLLRHHREGRLGLRVVHAVPLAQLENACRLGLRSGLGDDWLCIGGIKMFIDGSLGSQTAWMFAPYPGRDRDCGVPVLAGDELRTAVRRAVEHGWAIWAHAIGDRAVHEIVAAIRATRRVATPAMPHRVEHAQCVRPVDVRRMADAGIVASVQPCHILGDIATADRHWPRARRNAYPFRRLLRAGVTLAAGSDVPVESIDPRRSLYAAVTRTDERGAPAGGWFPAERIRVRDVLRAFTLGAAAAAGRPAPVGTLLPGAPADITIWADDPLAARPDELLHIRIHGVVVGGCLHLAGADA